MSTAVSRQHESEPELVIKHGKAADAAVARGFHVQNAGEFMWPRDEAEFNDLVEGRELFLLFDRGTVRGICYCSPGDDRWEFGGIYVVPALRGRGAAVALGRVAIGLAYAYDSPTKLIAHVHEFNSAPRNLLTEQLGFVDTGQSEVPPIEPPKSMRRNDAGQVVGDVFEFQPNALSEFADWFEQFDGVLRGKSGCETALAIDADVIKLRDPVVSALRSRAAAT